MSKLERREKILMLLTESKHPLTGQYLATTFGVSRQVIVQDIALLRASGATIVSTTQGYMLWRN